MCGIFGWSMNKAAVQGSKRGVLASMLATMNDTRGGHSWGYVGTDGKARRGLGDIAPHAFELAEQATLMAHTRLKTTGEVSIANAHPFEIGDIIGAHNGMIYNHPELNHHYGRKFAVDSMHLFAHLNDGLPFSELRGYGAIEWVDSKEPGKIFLSRLDNGELSIYGIGKDADHCSGIVWSSDGAHLSDAMDAAGIDCFGYKVDVGTVLYVEKRALYFKKDTTLSLGSYAESVGGKATAGGRTSRWSDDEDDLDLDGVEAWISSRKDLSDASKTASITQIRETREARERRRWIFGEKGARELERGRDSGARVVKGEKGAELLWAQKDPWDEYQEEAESESLDAELSLASDDGPNDADPALSAEIAAIGQEAELDASAVQAWLADREAELSEVE